MILRDWYDLNWAVRQLQKRVNFLASRDTLPDQTGHPNEFLTTDGTTPSWIAGVPGSLNIYNSNGLLSSARTLDMNGQVIQFLNGITPVFLINTAANTELSILKAINYTGGDNQSYTSHSTTAAGASMNLYGSFNGNIESFSIVGSATVLGGTLDYTADTQKLTFENLLTIERSTTQYLRADAGDDRIQLQNSVGSKIDINNDNDNVRINYIDDTTSIVLSGSSLITHTAASHTFTGNGYNALDLISGNSIMESRDPNNSDTRAYYNLSTVGLAAANIRTDYNDGEKTAEIALLSQPGSSTITYTADLNTFNGLATYDIDYSASYTDRSLVDKGYVVSNAGLGNIYSTDGTLAADRTIDLGGFTLLAQEGGNNFLTIQPDVNDEVFTIQAYNVTGDGNFGRLRLDTSELNGTFDLQANFNDGVKQARIQGYADNTDGLLTYTADKHAFVLPIGISNAFTVQEGTNQYINIDTTAGNEQTNIMANNATGGTNHAELTASTSNTRTDAYIQANFNGGTKTVGVFLSADSTRGKITLTSIEAFADNAAASGGGLQVGDLYRTGDLLKIVH